MDDRRRHLRGHLFRGEAVADPTEAALLVGMARNLLSTSRRLLFFGNVVFLLVAQLFVVTVIRGQPLSPWLAAILVTKAVLWFALVAIYVLMWRPRWRQAERLNREIAGGD